MTINRIYQGRVRAVEIFEEKDEEGKPVWKRLDDWKEALWRHHEIFQDAVNYYLVALGSLADPEYAAGNRVIADLRSRLEAAWEQFPRQPVPTDAKSLRDSIAPWIGLDEKSNLKGSFDRIRDRDNSDREVDSLALLSLLNDLGGEGKIQQGGRQYFPFFCVSNTKAHFPRGEVNQLKGKGETILPTLLWDISGSPNTKALTNIKKKLRFEYFANPKTTSELLTVDETKKRLNDAVDHLYNKKNIKDPEKWKKKIDNLQDVRIPAYSGGSINKEALKNRFYAWLLFNYIEQTDTTFEILRSFVKEPKKEKDLTKKQEEKNKLEELLLSKGDDPIKLARGAQGYIFRAFTALPDWNPKSLGEPVWSEFDIAAFKEALKSLNQFNQKTQERVENENNLRGQLAILLGSQVKGWKPRKTESGEDELAPEPLEPELFLLARDLERNLTEDLADTLVGEEKSVVFGGAVFNYHEGGWKLSLAALRGYRDISEEWNKLHAKPGKGLTPDQLQEIVKNYQRDERNRKSIGSIPLFLRLCERKYWPLWLSDNQEFEETISGKSFLHRMVSFHMKFRDFQRSLEPINLTPAEPIHSRRLYMFSDIKDKDAKVVFGKTDDGFAVECAIATQSEDGKLKEQRGRLHYSAKRLLRDELQGDVESRWLQPMTRALGLQMPEVKSETQFESAVGLMPDLVRQAHTSESAQRFLLNFPVTLDPSWIHFGLGKATIWKGQFNGTRDKNLHLHWPDTIKGKGGESPWWKDKKIIDGGFTCISIDLGQRTAGAWALLRVTCSDPRNGHNGTKRPVRGIGFDGERNWFAEVLDTGILRLPGEDQKVIDSKGSLQVERFGKAGRNALESEWEQGKKLASALFEKKPEAWMGKNFMEKSFSEQNDALIALANRRLSRLNTFHRWSCFDPDRPKVAERRDGMIQKLIEELGHWQDTEVALWKEFIEKGDFVSFRSVAGTAFESLREELGTYLVALANRTAPLRNRSWKWELSKDNNEQGVYGELLDRGAQLTSQPTWIRGQRGLSLSRIEQLEKLRQLFLRYNRSFDREPGKPAKFGRADFGRRSGEPCRLLLDKIYRMKEQRVNQTAHLILAQALGVRLKAHQIDMGERVAKDIHGEYEKIPSREPVDFIVIENLDRYLTSQGRAPFENSRLMKWAHRAVRDKIKMLAEEPFGIPVVETAAAYSSRFCAVTGTAGDRCAERTKLDDYLKDSLADRSKRTPKWGQPNPADFQKLLDQFTQLEYLNTDLQQARNEGKKMGKSLYTLFLPKQGGPLFLAVEGKDSEHRCADKTPKQADINAAINIGLRAVAAPDALDILHKVRTERDGDVFKPMLKNAREKAGFKKRPSITLNGKLSDKLAKARSPNFFYDSRAFDCFDSAYLTLEDRRVSLASGIGLWATVNKLFTNQIIAINRRRLERWQQELEVEEDIPM